MFSLHVVYFMLAMAEGCTFQVAGFLGHSLLASLVFIRGLFFSTISRVLSMKKGYAVKKGMHVP